VHGRELTSELRAVLALFAALALVAGFLLFVLAAETDRFFSWTIQPPLTAAFLGAAYWAAFILIGWTARRRLWIEARATMPPVLVIAVLLLAATFLHLDKFDFDSIFGWFWTTVYVLVPPALVLLLVRQLRMPGEDPPPSRSLPWGARALLAVQAIVMVGVGAALFIAPESADAVWPWKLTPLTARAIGAFVLGFGVAAAHATAENDFDRFRGAALAYTALGALELLALAIHSDDLSGESLDTWLYVAFLASVLGLGAYASARSRSASSPRSTSS
jgi:hypothetical protein